MSAPQEKNVPIRWKKNIAYMVVSVCLVLGALEIMLRVLNVETLIARPPEKFDIKRDVGDFIGFLESDLNMHSRKGGKSFYVEDAELMWRLTPGFEGKARDFFAVAVSDDPSEWTFKINFQGFRGKDFEIERGQGVYRVVALGDSCTFGFGVDEGDTYPERLQSELERLCPSCMWEVLNLGVPGFSSEQGRVLAERWLPILTPQAVIISYGTNDWWKRKFSDEEEMARLNTPFHRFRIFLRKSAIIKTGAILLSGLRGDGTNRSTDMQERVSPERYEQNIEKIAEIAASNGAVVILLDNNFYVPYGTKALRELAEKHESYILIDAVEILAKALQDPQALINRFPISTANSIRQYRTVIKKRPMFLVMVDPVHPNAVGFQLIAEEIAKVLVEKGKVSAIVEEKRISDLSLPKIKAVGGGFLDRTALEYRAALLNFENESPR